MGYWETVVSTQTTNYVKNSSFERSTLTDWTAMSGITASLNTTVSLVLFGLQSMRFQATATNTNGVYGELSEALPSATTQVTFYARGTLPSSWRIGLGTGTSVPANATTATAVETVGSWTRYHASFSSGDAANATRVFIVLPAAGSHTVDAYIDGVQVEQSTSGRTTYFDGSFGEGHEWGGQEHASKSTRFDWYGIKPVGGGYVQTLDDRTTVFCTGFTGVGAPGVKVLAQESAVQPGGLYQHTRFPPQTVVLSFLVKGTSYEDMLDQRAAILDKIPIGRPFELRYLRGSTNLARTVVYEGGLELQVTTGKGFTDRFSVRLVAYHDPMWRLIYDSLSTLTLQTSTATIKPYLLERRQGAWSYTDSGHTIRAMVEAADKTVYVGGGDTVKRRTAAGTLASIATVTGGGATVYALARSLSGQYVYIAGDFTNCGGTAANYIAAYDTSAGTFSALGTGMNGIVYGLAVSPYDGNLYAVGAFTTAGGTTVNRVARWNGSAWSALQSGVSGGGGIVYAIDIAPGTGDLYLVGDFTTGSQAATPGAPTVSGTTGGVFANGTTRYYKIASMTGTNEGSLGTSGNHTLSGNTAFSLTWTAVTNATGYAVYRAKSSAATAVYYLVGITTTNSFVDYGYTDGTKFDAAGGAVTAYETADTTTAFQTGDVRYYKASFTVPAGESRVGSSSNHTLTGSNLSFTATATRVAGVKGYNFYRALAAAGPYYYIGSTTAPTNVLTDNGYADTTRTPDAGATTTGSDSVNVARYDMSEGAYYNIGSTGALGGAVYAVKVLEDGVSCVIGGAFTWVDGQLANGVAYFNGSTLQPMGSGVSGGAVRAIAQDADGSILVGGAFTSAGGLTTAARLARWIGNNEGGAWTHTDLGSFSGSVVVYAILSRYRDILVGTDSAGGANQTWTGHATTAITNAGNADTYPLIAIVGPSTGSMTVYGLWIHNVGQIILNLTVYQSEMVMLDLRSGMMYSGVRVGMMSSLLPGSSVGSLLLRPGANTVGLLCTGTVTNARAVVIDRTGYLSVDM